MHTSTLRTDDGLLLHRQDWPASGTARGTVLIVHGLGEHIGRYAHVAQALNAGGWHVCGYDHRGHGRSEGARGVLTHSDDLLKDLAHVIDDVRKDRQGPLVLLGHSMGGLVAARFVAEGLQDNARDTPWFREVDALVLSSPALAAHVSMTQRLLLGTLGAIAPQMPNPNGLKPEWVSRDPQVVADYRADALVHDRVTPRLANFILGGGEWVRAKAPLWKLPTLLLYAGQDRCVAAEGSAAFAEAAPSQKVAVRHYDALFHEIFNEPERDTVLADLRAWLDALPAWTPP